MVKRGEESVFVVSGRATGRKRVKGRDGDRETKRQPEGGRE